MSVMTVRLDPSKLLVSKDSCRKTKREFGRTDDKLASAMSILMIASLRQGSVAYGHSMPGVCTI